ncbi:ABC transporter permease [Galbibacter mesophilus]|uniref:ABC transporter permease n=1 Tax=Galbibacter mesophilus TaxID=379069 RepID=UPI00191EC9AF|nr:ABC transporter permease [Galbibacter mesophilus]MCM5663144.1 ABC transporter permease [Galbibacter mesophilus]
MNKLLSVEIFKLYKQGKTYYALAAIFVIQFLILIGAYFQGNSIIDILLSNIKDSFYFEGNLLNGNLMIYLILNTLWFHLPLILMIVISGMLTTEYKDNTVQSILLQPVVKWKFILNKFLIATLFTLLVVFLTALSSFLFSYIFFGKGDLIVYLGNLTFFEHSEAIYRLILAFLSGANSMIFFSVVSLTIAVLLKEATKTWIISALFLVINNILLKFESDSYFFNQWFFPKLNNTWQYFFYEEIPWDIIAHNNLVLLGYTIFFLILGVIIFNKRDII